MDPLLLKYYNRELQYIREMGGEFAKEFPKIAGRLGLDGIACADPYVERLLEGFGFLAARVQLSIDAKFPRFTQHLLDIVYPHYLTPTPWFSSSRTSRIVHWREASLFRGTRHCAVFWVKASRRPVSIAPRTLLPCGHLK